MISSVVYKQIKKFQETLKDKISYEDLNYRGIDSNGSVTVKDGNCIIDEFQLWLLSDINDYNRQPDKGGFITKEVIKKPFNDNSCSTIKSQLLVEANAQFPTIKIENCSVVCNYSTRKWEIRISAYDTESNAISNNITAEIPSTT